MISVVNMNKGQIQDKRIFVITSVIHLKSIIIKNIPQITA